MAISARIRQQFAQKHGFTLKEVSESPKLREHLGKGKTKKLEEENNGRGYIHFGKSVSASEKEEENLEMLKYW